MRILPLSILIALLLGCSQPPKLSTSLDVQKQGDDMVVVKLKVINTENRATVPINVEVTGQAETDGHWSKRETVIHPAAFVLNRNEQREITQFWKVPAQAVRTTLVVKEQERGDVLKTEKAEKVFPAGAPSAATSH